MHNRLTTLVYFFYFYFFIKYLGFLHRMLVSTRPAGPLRRLPLCLSLASKPVHCSPCSLRQASIHRGPTLVPTQRRSFIIPSNNMDLKSSSFTNAVVSAMRSLYVSTIHSRALFLFLFFFFFSCYSHCFRLIFSYISVTYTDMLPGIPRNSQIGLGIMLVCCWKIPKILG